MMNNKNNNSHNTEDGDDDDANEDDLVRLVHHQHVKVTVHAGRLRHDHQHVGQHHHVWHHAPAVMIVSWLLVFNAQPTSTVISGGPPRWPSG